MAAISVSEMEKQSVETRHLLCSPCKRKERNKKADKYCADCHDYYCSDCVKFHEDIPALSRHKILDKDQVKDGTSGTLPVTPTQRCERHGFKPVDMYCQGHDSFGCSTCMAVDHRSCNDVFYVPEYVLDHDPTSQCEDVQRKMLAVTGDIEFQLKIRQREMKRLFKRKEDEVEKIKQFRIDIIQTFDNLEKKSIDNIEGKYKAIIKKIEEQCTILTTFQTDVKSSAEEIKSVSSNMSQKFVGMKVANSVTERADNGLKEETMGFKRFDVIFQVKPKLMSMIDQMDRFGEIVEKPALYRLGEKKEISIKHDSDSNSSYDIRSICKPKDGCVIIADMKNKSLKRLDMTSFKILDVCKLPRCPWQICEVDNDIAVSSQEMNIDIITT
ncbi:E3 ubiquitin-protein ligase TRIM71-like isoform X1 [Ruditapes philippinarum]|uniref:E3 ubiquitin-protein ligase TRIM71-like isoform X1 n=1 Tax=Ruditapes philippinarum TaxID=129788 RepID=UPI00295BE7D4|nr:E3 ubiquitin-protein ligase TRIM71-like isoform X1 [Ruditapes philippinarum]